MKYVVSIAGIYYAEVPPVPIPNTEVKAGSIPARVTKRMDLGREAGFRYMAKRLNAAKH